MYPWLLIGLVFPVFFVQLGNNHSLRGMNPDDTEKCVFGVVCDERDSARLQFAHVHLQFGKWDTLLVTNYEGVFQACIPSSRIRKNGYITVDGGLNPFYQKRTIAIRNTDLTAPKLFLLTFDFPPIRLEQ